MGAFEIREDRVLEFCEISESWVDVLDVEVFGRSILDVCIFGSLKFVNVCNFGLLNFEVCMLECLGMFLFELLDVCIFGFLHFSENVSKSKNFGKIFERSPNDSRIK